MNKVKIVPKVTLVAQLPAGLETEVIEDGGILYLPVMDLSKVLSLPTGKVADTKVTAPATKAAPKVEPKEEKTTSKVYEESELEEMEQPKLLEILEDLGVDPNESEGKNTRRKLINLIIEKQDGASEEDNDTPPAEESVAEEDEELISWKKLKKGQEVSVYWEGDFDDWFNGVVHDFKKTADGNMPVIKYDDGDIQVIVPEMHTKIKLVTV